MQGSFPSHAARQLLGGWYLPGGYCLFFFFPSLSEKTEEHEESGGADKLQGAGKSNMRSCEVLQNFSLSVSFSSKLAEPLQMEEQGCDTACHKASAAPQDPLPKGEKHTPPSPTPTTVPSTDPLRTPSGCHKAVSQLQISGGSKTFSVCTLASY